MKVIALILETEEPLMEGASNHLKGNKKDSTFSQGNRI